MEDCHFRMLGPHEVGRGCRFDTTFPGHAGEFTVRHSARDQCDGFGNAVSPSVGAWIGSGCGPSALCDGLGRGMSRTSPLVSVSSATRFSGIPTARTGFRGPRHDIE